MDKNHSNKTLLVVDDDIDYLTQMKVNLIDAGFNVVTAEGQKKAEEYLEQNKPDLAILDLMMEEMDGGFALSYHIKKLDPSIPVIIVSAVNSEAGIEFDAVTKEERSWIKADAFLAKPVRFEQLVREINRLLNQ
ncbi:response regulator [candidate division KSB1 bacterium]|nr:response regulator [candidate division KSB1 bacterium]